MAHKRIAAAAHVDHERRAHPPSALEPSSARELEDMWREMGGSESDDDAGGDARPICRRRAAGGS